MVGKHRGGAVGSLPWSGEAAECQRSHSTAQPTRSDQQEVFTPGGGQATHADTFQIPRL